MKYAGFWRRFFAALLDGLLVGFVSGVLGAMFPNNMQAVRVVISLGLAWGYLVYFIGSRGQTLGKMALGVKVVSVTGKKIDYQTAALREILGKVLSSLLLDLGYLWMIWDKKKQTWHDKIAKTVVVRV